MRLRVQIGLLPSSTLFPSFRSSLPSPQQTGLSPLATGNYQTLTNLICCSKSCQFWKFQIFWKEAQSPPSRQTLNPCKNLWSQRSHLQSLELKRIENSMVSLFETIKPPYMANNIDVFHDRAGWVIGWCWRDSCSRPWKASSNEVCD